MSRVRTHIHSLPHSNKGAMFPPTRSRDVWARRGTPL